MWLLLLLFACFVCLVCSSSCLNLCTYVPYVPQSGPEPGARKRPLRRAGDDAEAAEVAQIERSGNRDQHNSHGDLLTCLVWAGCHANCRSRCSISFIQRRWSGGRIASAPATIQILVNKQARSCLEIFVRQAKATQDLKKAWTHPINYQERKRAPSPRHALYKAGRTQLITKSARGRRVHATRSIRLEGRSSFRARCVIDWSFGCL